MVEFSSHNQGTCLIFPHFFRISTDETGALTVSNVRYEDNGLYKCIASTETGTSERSAVITVKS